MIRKFDNHIALAYLGQPFMVIQKARIMFWGLAAACIAVGLALAIDLSDGEGSSLEAVLYNCSVVPVMLYGLISVYRGNYVKASTWIVSLGTLVLCGSTMIMGLGNKPQEFYQTSVHFFALPILFAALLTNRKTLLLVVVFILMGICGYWALFCANLPEPLHSDSFNLFSYAIVSMLIISVLIYGLMALSEMSLHRLATQLAENKKLNEELEERVLARTLDLQKARNDAEAATRAKSDFLANMSHEIRTPLSGILGMTQLLAKRPMDEEDSENVQVILDSGHHLLSVIQDILDYSKIEAGRMEMDVKPFALDPLLHMVRNVVEAKALEKSLSMEFIMDPTLPPWVIGDEIRLRQVLLNIVGNAVKFTEKGFVKVLMQCKALQGNSLVLHVAVRDSGIGMDAKAIARIFERYMQAETSTTRRYGGTGLGVAISRSLLKLMGSELTVNSILGKGTEFEFDLPLTIFDASRQGSNEGSVPRERPFGAGRPILVVEDNPLNAKLICRVLENQGFAPTWAENGKIALTLLEEKPFVLVFLDCHMPILDGFETIRIIRQWKNHPSPLGKVASQIPVIGLTADALLGSRDSCLEAGMNDYLSKPFQIESIEKLLRVWLPVG